MPEEPSKYASNQFLIATEGSFPLMGELLDTTVPRITAAALAYPGFVPARVDIVAVAGYWDDATIATANAEAEQIGATAAFEDRMESLTRNPDLDTNSTLETWDVTVRTQVAYGGSIYKVLLPQGRETLTAGDYTQRLDAIAAFGTRLVAQGTLHSKPALNTLGATVTAWHAEANDLREAQNTKKTAVETVRANQELQRQQAAAALYAMVGDGMRIFKDDPAQVDTLFVVGLLRGPARAVPQAPVDTLWTPAARRLSTSVLPVDATRLEAWRQGPGGAPELLAVGERDALEVTIPAEYTFDPGDLYQLWLQGLNSKGSSLPGPKQSWTAT